MNQGNALYVEIDHYAAAWIENLIGAGLICGGDVYCGDVRDVTPRDLARYNQVHLYAGIAVWSYGLRRAGIADTESVWTFSEPCQPFSSAGKRLGFADERYLRPYTHHLISQCRPNLVLGEQVASKDGLAWFDVVQSDMESAGYTIGVSDTCSAGFGAPHIRQRLRFAAVAKEWMADCDKIRCSERGAPHVWRKSECRNGSDNGCVADIVADCESQQREQFSSRRESSIRRKSETGELRSLGIVADRDENGQCAAIQRQGGGDLDRRRDDERSCVGSESGNQNGALVDDVLQQRSERLPLACPVPMPGGRIEDPGPVAGFCGDSVMADSGLSEKERQRSYGGEILPDAEPERSRLRGDSVGVMADGIGTGLERRDEGTLGRQCAPIERGGSVGRIERPGPVNGFWRNADWLYCRDGKWRAVEPGTFPLAHGVAGRVGKLRAYGNAVDGEATAEFCKAVGEELGLC